MAKISRRRLARELVRVLKEQPERRRDIVRQTAAYLIDTKQSGQAHLLVNDIADELMQTDAHLAAEIRSAFPLTQNARQNITATLKQQTGAKTVELSEEIMPELLGGVVVRAPGYELDASVRRQLKQITGGTA
ncbi:MAG: F0F1 ATP synthase subunit delta [Candidatus Saccharimonadales bacterium]